MTASGDWPLERSLGLNEILRVWPYETSRRTQHFPQHEDGASLGTHHASALGPEVQPPEQGETVSVLKAAPSVVESRLPEVTRTPCFGCVHCGRVTGAALGAGPVVPDHLLVVGKARGTGSCLFIP